MKKWENLTDKTKHFIIGFIIASAYIFSGMYIGYEYEVVASQSVALLFIVGASKEVYDYVTTRWFGQKHTVEVADMLYTVIGAMPYFVFHVLSGMGS
jgi:hypothetical protein